MANLSTSSFANLPKSKHKIHKISAETAKKCFGSISPVKNDNSLHTPPPPLFYFDDTFDLSNEFINSFENTSGILSETNTTTTTTNTSIAATTQNVSCNKGPSKVISTASFDREQQLLQEFCNIAEFCSNFFLEKIHYNQWHSVCMQCCLDKNNQERKNQHNEEFDVPQNPFCTKFKYRSIHALKISANIHYVNYIFFKCKDLGSYLNSLCNTLTEWNLSMYKQQSFVLITKANNQGHIESFDQVSAMSSMLLLGEIYVCILLFFKENFKDIVKRCKEKLNACANKDTMPYAVNNRLTIYGPRMIQKEYKAYVFSNGNIFSICLQISASNVKCCFVYKSGQDHSLLLKKIDINTEIFETLSKDCAQIENFINYKKADYLYEDN